MKGTSADVIVVGAGAAGLMAALELALTGKSVLVLEARAGAGGRIKTVHTTDGQTVELGAEFVHGDLPLTKMLLKKAGCDLLPMRGQTWQHKNGQLTKAGEMIANGGAVEKKLAEVKADVSVADFLTANFPSVEDAEVRQSVLRYVEGYYAADPKKASALALREEWESGDEEQYRPAGGYGKLVAYLEAECRKHKVRFEFSEPVTDVSWQKDDVKVKTLRSEYTSRKVLLTLTVSLLQTNAIRISPAMPEKIAAAQALGFGNVAKVVLNFKTPFWKDEDFAKRKDLAELGFLFSEEAFPTWWTQHPADAPLLAGWLGGPGAEAVKDLHEDLIVKKALNSLRIIFKSLGSDVSERLVSAHFHNWQTDPFTMGAYSYNVPNGQTYMQTILKPAENTVFFAGEGLHAGPQIGTVEAALVSGRLVAHRIVACFL